MKRTFKIYKECIKAAFLQASAYRLNFFLTTFITLVGNLLFPLITILIYNSGAEFSGWNFYEVLLIQSIFTFSSGFSGIIVGEVFFRTMVCNREGNFEVILLKPVHPLFFIMASSFNPEFFGLMIGGIVLFVIAILHTGVASFFAIIEFLILFFSGTAVMTGISFIMAATSFKWIGNSRIPEIANSLNNFGKYPASVYPSALKSVITFIIPVAMVGFYPASALLGRLDPIVFLAVIPCILFMLFGIWLYNYMIMLYEGVGG